MSAPTGLMSELKEIKDRLEQEYDFFYSCSRKLSDDELSEKMRDSDFDAATDGKASRAECISRYRSRCSGRATTAGNYSGLLRNLIHRYSPEKDMEL